MNAIRNLGARALGAALTLTACAAAAVEFVVPVEVAGVNAQVKSLRITCTAAASDGTTRGSASGFVALNAGATNQPISIKVDVAQPKGLPHASSYQCEVDRIFDTDVTQMKPLPEAYLQPAHKMTVGAPHKDLHLQMNSVWKVGGKL